MSLLIWFLLYPSAIICAILQALEASGVGLEKEDLEGLDRAKCGILVGTAMGGMQTFSTAVEDLTLKVHASYTPPSAIHVGQPCLNLV